MPLPALIGKAIGKALEDTAVDAVKIPRIRSRKSKKSGKAQTKGKSWVIVLVLGILLILLLSHGHLGR